VSLLLIHKKRTHAVPANGVIRNVELPPEVQSFVAVQDLGQRAVVNVADRAVEKTRPYRAVGLDHRGYPRCVAPRSHYLHMPESCSEMKRDASKFVRLLHDKP